MEQAGAEAAVPGEGAAVTGDELARLREALLTAYPETVAELVAGESVGELLASLERAGAAYRAVAAAVAGRAEATAAAGTTAGMGTAPAVPAGDGRPLALDPERLPTVEKIRRGLAGRA
jgi:hypothetical protein